MKSHGWGIVAPGRFAREFAAELRAAPRARLVAVASRSRERAAGFARDFGFARSYGDYASLFSDPEVDLVYVAAPHPFHDGLAREALDAGKAVLCEKPLTPSLEETRALCAYAKERGRFLMEGMKTGFLPAVRRAREWVAEGRIGKPLLLRADFCFRGPEDPADRLMNPDLAGGAILDVGIYPLHLARYLLGEVLSLHASGSLAATGVEDSAAILTRHADGASALGTCSFRTTEHLAATLLGTEGEIRLPKFHAATLVERHDDEGLVERYEDASGGMVGAEIAAAMDALEAGRLECPGHTHEDSIQLAALVEEARRQVLGGGSLKAAPR